MRGAIKRPPRAGNNDCNAELALKHLQRARVARAVLGEPARPGAEPLVEVALAASRLLDDGEELNVHLIW